MAGLLFRIFIQVVIVAGGVGMGARKLGYSGVLWFFAQLFGGWFTLGLVSSLPDRRLNERRAEELAQLRRELEQVGRVLKSSSAVPDETIGNMTTIRTQGVEGR